MGLDGIKSVPVYSSGGFVDTYNTSIQHTPAGYATGERYRYLDDGVSATSEKYQYIEDNDYQTVSSRYAGAHDPPSDLRCRTDRRSAALPNLLSDRL